MSKLLILNSLEVRQFRVFRHLRVERLGRVNLIVGKNGVGKTALLEALRLYVSQVSPELPWELLYVRDEGFNPRYIDRDREDDFIWNIRYLFHGRGDIREVPASIQIGPINSSGDKLSIEIKWSPRRKNDKASIAVPDEGEKIVAGGQFPYLCIQRGVEGKEVERVYNLSEAFMRFGKPWIPETKTGSYIFISAGGLNAGQISQLWDNIALTNLEADILAALQIIAPEIERLNLIGSPERDKERIPIVKVAGLNTPIPLRSLGEGMARMFGIALALVNSKDGMLLIDEVESGLHYSVQPDLWRLIFQIAHRLDIQVFATTHSWDCVEAFQQAAQENEASEGVLINLRRKKDDILAAILDERKLGIATREQIEVR